MSKFGELIDIEIPVLLDFYKPWNDQPESMHLILRDVAAALGDKAKIIKIDIEKNEELTQALRIKTLPTLIIYKDGEMKWRQSGEQNSNMLINKMQEYI